MASESKVKFCSHCGGAIDTDDKTWQYGHVGGAVVKLHLRCFVLLGHARLIASVHNRRVAVDMDLRQSN